MAKKPSMPDFTFALGADLREAAAKMRKMSQPPKHQSAQQSEDSIDAIPYEEQEIIEESATLESSETEEPIPVTSPGIDVPIEPETLPMDLPHGEEVSSATLEPSEEATGPIDAIESVEDIVQPLDRVADSKETEDIPVVPPHGAGTEPHEVPQEEFPQEPHSVTPVAQGEYRETLQSPPSESCSENVQTSACISEAGPVPPLSDAQADASGIADTAQSAEQSMTDDYSYNQKNTIDDSHKHISIVSASEEPSSTTTARHQQTHSSINQSQTVNDTYVLAPPHMETDPPLASDRGVATDANSHSLYSQLTYGQPQAVTDYQFHSTSLKVSPPPYGSVTTIPKDPFQNRAAAPKATGSAQVPPSSDRHELSQAVTKPMLADKQPVEPKEFSPKQPAAQARIPQGISPSLIAATLQDAHLGGARQVLLDALTALRQQSPQVVVNLKRLAPAIGLSYGTVRNTISRLVREGVICTTQVRTGDAHGVCVEFVDDNPLPSITAPQRVRPPMTYQQQSQTVMRSHEKDTSIPADDTCIWNTDAELIAILWPFASDAGFGPAHLAQLRRAYQLQGWESENVSRCLRYLDWELANGVPAAHEHVSTWLRIMQRQGHYPRPEGYVDPEILRLRQQAEEERELAEARTRFK